MAERLECVCFRGQDDGEQGIGAALKGRLEENILRMQKIRRAGPFSNNQAPLPSENPFEEVV
jgi:hypothetical protein